MPFDRTREDPDIDNMTEEDDINDREHSAMKQSAASNFGKQKSEVKPPQRETQSDVYINEV